jgi:hypothetical protein
MDGRFTADTPARDAILGTRINAAMGARIVGGVSVAVVDAIAARDVTDATAVVDARA